MAGGAYISPAPAPSCPRVAEARAHLEVKSTGDPPAPRPHRFDTESMGQTDLLWRGRVGVGDRPGRSGRFREGRPVDNRERAAPVRGHGAPGTVIVLQGELVGVGARQ